MGRRKTVAALAVLATLAVLGTSQAQEGGAAGGGVGFLTVATLLLAAGAVGVAALALVRARHAHTELTRFTRSIEMALRDLSLRSERDAASIGELSRKIGEEMLALTERTQAEPAPPTAAPAPGQATETVPQARQPAERPGEPEPAVSAEAVERALVRAVQSGDIEVSLQPIISVSQSAASGFEAHAHLEPGEGARPVDIRRLAQPVAGLDPSAFEVAMVRAAIAAGRRQLGTATERMPFHVAVSDALLGNADEIRSLAELAEVHKALTASLVLSVPASLLAAGGETRARLDQLTSAGFRLAAENWDGSAADAASVARRGVAFVKLAANRLLDRERTRRRMAAGAELASAAQEAGLTVVATGVNGDEDAVALIDLGIDLMVGERFSGPRRIRSAAARQATMTGT